MKRVHIFISGIVQGVGFRHFVEENAKIRNVKGYVKNIYDGERAGQVEVVFEGEDKVLEYMIKLCKTGPLFSHVENVDVNEEEFKGEYQDFWKY